MIQDFGNQIVRPTPRDDSSFGPLNFGCEDWRERTEAVLNDLDIAHIADAQTWQLSGGQQHLTALAGVLALAPDIIVRSEERRVGERGRSRWARARRTKTTAGCARGG